jgi:RNA polymerase-binding transcription factor DksA
VNHRDFSFAQASAYNELLGEINHALRRIEEGRYGVCEITGKPIPMSRLKAIPWTRFVAAAERKLEKHGRSPVHFKLPPAGGLKGGGFSEEPLSTEPEETEGGEE